jgi:hypothetical protein
VASPGFLSAVNEELRRRAGASGLFVCECGDDECVATLELTTAEFDGARAAGELVIAFGHAGPRAVSDVGHIRAALRGRVHAAWERLDDAVAELEELHEVPMETIVYRVRSAEDGG